LPDFYYRRGRQLSRVLATTYEEVVVDQLFAGNTQLSKAVQPVGEGRGSDLAVG
jgi:hypothetical protein